MFDHFRRCLQQSAEIDQLQRHSLGSSSGRKSVPVDDNLIRHEIIGVVSMRF